MPRQNPLREAPLRETPVLALPRSGPEARLSLPFLPTLVTALVIGAASLLCREPAVAPVHAPAVGPQAFAPAVPAEPAPRAPAALIFAEHYPLAAGAVPRPVPRLAAAASRRQALRAAEPARRPEVAGRPAAAADPLAPARDRFKGEAAETAEAETLLPSLVLPFTQTVVPAVRAAGEAAAFLGDRASALGGSVSLAVAAMR